MRCDGASNRSSWNSCEAVGEGGGALAQAASTMQTSRTAQRLMLDLHRRMPTRPREHRREPVGHRMPIGHGWHREGPDAQGISENQAARVAKCREARVHRHNAPMPPRLAIVSAMQQELQALLAL